MVKPVEAVATEATRNLVAKYAEFSKRMTLEEHVDAIANITANVMEAVYGNRKKNFPPDAARRLAVSLGESIGNASLSVFNSKVGGPSRGLLGKQENEALEKAVASNVTPLDPNRFKS